MTALSQGVFEFHKLLESVPETELPFHNLNPKVIVEGPFTLVELEDRYSDEIYTFRRSHCPEYLFDKFHAKLAEELKIDERSAHFVAKDGDEILGYVRLTPTPFEISALHPVLAELESQFDNYYEVSRMVTSPRGQSQWVGIILCFALIRYGLQGTRTGLIALCRLQNAARFNFLGFKRIPTDPQPITIAAREGAKYQLMAATWDEFCSRLARIFGREFINHLGTPLN